MATKISSRSPRWFALLLLPLLVAAKSPIGVGAAKSPAGVVVTAPAPISLTASDGAGLDLVSLTASAVVDDPLAFTELHLTFRNPDKRVREGRFRITLPPGATLSRFAMRIGDRWQEGEVVEQQAARVAYEDFLHHRQDPALLENEAGNEFSARVFPIPAAATKEIVVSYSQGLARASEPYRLPLRGLPRLGLLSVQVRQGDAGKVAEAKKVLETNARYLKEQSAQLKSERLEIYGKQNAKDADNLDDRDWSKSRKGMRASQHKNATQQSY